MNSNKSLTPGSPSPATLHAPLSNLTSNDLSWEYLRKQARQFENELEQKLTSYSKIAAQVGRSVGYSKEGKGATGNSSEAMELELEELIKKVYFFSNLILNLRINLINIYVYFLAYFSCEFYGRSCG